MALTPVVVIALSAFFLTQSKPAQAFGGGTGTHADPYQITTCQELQDVTKDVAASYVLANDIDCSETSSWSGGSGFRPIGMTADSTVMDGFSGTLDGQGHTIDGLYQETINQYDKRGLFYKLSRGVVRNLKLTNQVLTSSAQNPNSYLGGLAAEATNADVAGVSVEATITAAGEEYSIGGLIARIDAGKFYNNRASVEITLNDGLQAGSNTSYIGGFTGLAQQTPQIVKSYVTGSINHAGTSSPAKIGGFAGRLGYMADVTDSFAQVALAPGGSDTIGGFTGESEFSDDGYPQSYFDATLAGTTNCTSQESSYCTAVNSDGLDADYFNNNSTNPPLDTWDFDDIWQLEATTPSLRATTIALPTALAAPTNVGAVAYKPTIANISWAAPAGTVTEYAVQYKPTGTDTWMQSYTFNGTKQAGTITNLSPETSYDVRVVARDNNVWGDISNVVAVTTPAVGTLPGEGSITDPYRVSSCEDLRIMSDMLQQSGDNDNDYASYILTQDIDCSDSINYNGGAGFVPMSGFYGIFDGQGHAISGLYINGGLLDQAGFYPNQLGLLSYLDGIVRNLRLVDQTIITSADQTNVQAGGVTAYAGNSAILLGVHVDLNLAGTNTDYLGGLVSQGQGFTISKSSASGTITMEDTVVDTAYGSGGGLVAYANSNVVINNSYSTMALNITGDTSGGSQLSAGGLAAKADNMIITNSYSSGAITVTNSLSSSSYVGGIVGFGGSSFSPTINDSFTTSAISTPDGCISCGAIIGGDSLDSNITQPAYYDQTAVGIDVCSGDQSNTYTCTPINTDGSQPNYFVNNSSNPPLDEWDFTTVWQAGVGLPTHKIFENTNPNPPTNLIAASSGSTITATWEAPLNTGSAPISGYIVQYRATPNGAWQNADTPDAGTQYTIEGLGTATQYAIRVFARNEDGYYSQPTNTVFATTNLEGYIPIETCQNLQDIDNDLAGNYYLVHDIDCTESINYNSGAGFSPLGVVSEEIFTGNFAGNGYTIKGLYIDATALNISGDWPIGMFAGVGQGDIQNVRIKNARIKAEHAGAGVLAGYLMGGSIYNAQIETSTIENVGPDSAVGGLVGSAGDDEGKMPAISQSSFSGTIINNVDGTQELNATGGLVGVIFNDGALTTPVVDNSYAKANITVDGQNSPAVIVGGLVGFGEIESGGVAAISKSYAAGSIEYDAPAETSVAIGGIAGYVSEGKIENVFSATNMPTPSGSHYVGGITAVTGGEDASYPTNSYYDASRGKTSDCIGFIADNEISGNDASCVAVNQNGSQANYFHANKTNPPLNTWDFANIWLVTNTYPDFQTNGALTPASPEHSITPTTPTEPTDPGEGAQEEVTSGEETVAVASETEKSGAGTQKKEEAKTVEPGILGAIKNFVRSLPKGVVESFPYALFGLLIAAALGCLIALWQEIRRLHALRILLAKQNVLAEERDTFWHLAANYLRAPVTLIVGGAEALSSASRTSTTAAISAAAQSLQTKVAGIMSQIEASKTLQDMGKAGNSARIHTIRRALFFVPVLVVGVLAILANYAAVNYRDLSPGTLGYLSQLAIFVIGTIVFYWTLDLLTRGRQRRRAAQRRLDLQTEQLSTARTALIQDTATMLGDDLTKLEGSLITIPATAPGLTTLKEGTSRLRQIVTSFGMLIRLQSSQGVANAADLPVNQLDDLLGGAVAQLSAKAKAKNIRITMPTQTGLTISGEPDLVAQAVYSILANAIEFTSENGTVTVQVRKTDDGVQLRIADQGPGIDAEQLPHLFQPFVRTDGKSALDLSHQGFGINLYIDKLIMDHVGGSIKAASKPGEGTSITMNWH